MAKSRRSSRRRGSAWSKQLRDKGWLAIPLSIVVAVAVLAVVNSGQQTSARVDTFVADSPGVPLPPQEPAPPGEQFPDEGRQHVPEGQRVQYNTNPPTSGAHYDTWAVWGIYAEAPEDEKLVHNLEHGGIVIYYDPDQIEGQTLDQLKGQVRQLSRRNPRIILTPRENFEGAIALTAWQYLQRLDHYDAAAIEQFYDAHIARGPECQEGLCPP